MAQYSFPVIVAEETSGSQLADYLNDNRPAIYSQHAGNARPSYAQRGLLWADESQSGQVRVALFDGAQDVLLGSAQGGQWRSRAHRLDLINGSNSLALTADSSGNLVVAGQATVAREIALSRATAATENATLAGDVNGVRRWSVVLGHGAEGGSNAGSNFSVYRFADNGALLGEAMSINRASGVTTFNAQVSLAGDPTDAVHAARKAYVDAQRDTRVPLAGGTMSGALVVNADIHARRPGEASGNAGAVFLGNSGSRYVYFNGTGYLMPNGSLTVGGALNATSLAVSGNVTSTGGMTATHGFSSPGDIAIGGQMFSTNYMLNDDNNSRDTGMQWGGAETINFVCAGQVRGQIAFGGVQFWTNVAALGDFIHNSDARGKRDVEVIAEPLAKIAQLRGVTYERIADGKRSSGIVAQDVERVLPELVTQADDGSLAVATGNLVGLLIEGQKALLEGQQALLARLEALEQRGVA